jgi:hypothetical protein
MDNAKTVTEAMGSGKSELLKDFRGSKNYYDHRSNEIVISEFAKKRMVERELREDTEHLDTTEWGQEEWDAFEKHERMHVTNTHVMNFEATEIDTPSISSSAMLVEVRINCWTGLKKDKAASEEVTTDKKADRGTATVTKKLLGDCATLRAIDLHSKNARTASHKRTLPWADTGPRLLSTEQYFKFHPEMTEWQNEFYKLVDDFDRAYPFELAQAQVRLGDKFAEPVEGDKVNKNGDKVFRDTLFTNMHHMLEMLKTCNVTGDCQMEAMRLRIEDALHGITPSAVRQDSRLRAETKRAMDDAIAQIPTLDM